MDQHNGQHNGQPQGQPDETPKKRPLSEISHLFLSSVRDGQFPGLPRPQRTPPPRKNDEAGATPPVPPAAGAPAARPHPEQSIDMTPEEFAQVFGETAAPAPATRQPPVTAIVSAHLNGTQVDRVKEYAKHLAGQVGRIGLMELDASEFRLVCYEAGAAPSAAEPAASESYDPRQMAEAIEELNFDVDRWLLMLPNPRTPEARALMKEVDHWVLLSTCDHDGVVSSYRMLKGLAEARRTGSGEAGPLRVTLALLDGRDEAEMARVVRKLAGVSQQFLDLELAAEAPVRRSYHIAENLVLLSRPTRDKAQMANPPQWSVVAQFLARRKSLGNLMPASPARTQPLVEDVMEAPVVEPRQDDLATEPRVVAEMVIPTAGEMPASELPATSTEAVEPQPVAAPAVPVAPLSLVPMPEPEPGIAMDEVLELDGPVTSGSLLSSVLRRSGGVLVECPVRPPMCAEARLAVSREHGVMLLAVARQGLAELRSIAQAYQWLTENLSLIAMAVPQFAIDGRLTPKLRLLVDQRDASAEVLRPILQSGNVTLQAYRMVRWGERTGLLLDAA